LLSGAPLERTRRLVFGVRILLMSPITAAFDRVATTRTRTKTERDDAERPKRAPSLKERG